MPATLDHAAEIHDLLEEIVTHWGLDLEVAAGPENDTIVVQLTGADVQFLQDDGGKVLEALQYLVSKMASRLLTDNVRVLLDADGFRSGRDEKLRQEALDLAARAKEDGRKIRMEPLNPYERRIVHLALKEIPGVRTFSVGQGYRKRLTIDPFEDDGSPDDRDDDHDEAPSPQRSRPDDDTEDDDSNDDRSPDDLDGDEASDEDDRPTDDDDTERP